MTKIESNVHNKYGLYLGVLLAAFSVNAVQANYLENDTVQTYIEEVSSEHNVDAAKLRALFKQISVQQSVIDKMSRPAEKRLTWKQYRPIFLKQDRIDKGIAFMRENAELLQRAEREFAVPKEIITAIIGVETKYGRITGNHPVFSSVATLAFDYPPRSKFFRSELTQFLLLSEEEGINPITVKGSYAGAMGMSQFISSSYRHYAVDFDGDGKRDLFNSTADAIGSVANYFNVHKWKWGEAVVESASVPDNTAYKELISDKLKPASSRQELIQAGFQPKGESSGQLNVMSFEGNEGTELWVGHHNFYVITRYNHSPLYAMAVWQLSQKLKLGTE